jgi:hypothetical protein
MKYKFELIEENNNLKNDVLVLDCQLFILKKYICRESMTPEEMSFIETIKNEHFKHENLLKF